MTGSTLDTPYGAAQIFHCEQGSAEWFRIRLGIPTGSEFHTVLAEGKDGGKSLTREAYKRRFAAEIITGEHIETYVSPDMRDGTAKEPEARAHYEFMCDEPLEQVGFIRRGNVGVSPDSLVGKNGMLEIKRQRGDLLIVTLDKGEDPNWFPPEHKPQCQGNLWIAGREWIDLSVYWPRMPRFVRRAYRDEAYIRKLAAEVDRFNEELAALVERLRRMEPDFVAPPPAELNTEQQAAALLADVNERGPRHIHWMDMRRALEAAARVRDIEIRADGLTEARKGVSSLDLPAGQSAPPDLSEGT